MVCGIEASYIPDMLVQYPVIALVLSSALDSCNNQDIVLALGYNYNLARVTVFGKTQHNYEIHVQCAFFSTTGKKMSKSSFCYFYVKEPFY